MMNGIWRLKCGNWDWDLGVGIEIEEWYIGIYVEDKDWLL